MILKLKRPWKKPTIAFFSNIDNVERRIETLQRRIESIRHDYISDPDNFEDAIDILVAYKEELIRLQSKYHEFLKLSKYEYRTAW